MNRRCDVRVKLNKIIDLIIQSNEIETSCSPVLDRRILLARAPNRPSVVIQSKTKMDQTLKLVLELSHIPNSVRSIIDQYPTFVRLRLPLDSGARSTIEFHGESTCENRLLFNSILLKLPRPLQQPLIVPNRCPWSTYEAARSFLACFDDQFRKFRLDEYFPTGMDRRIEESIDIISTCIQKYGFLMEYSHFQNRRHWFVL